MTVKALVEARGEDMYSRLKSQGLRYLIQPDATKDTKTRIVSRVDSNTKVRRNCASDLATMARGPRQLNNHQTKDIDRVVQRPRAVLSSPDNDHLIKEMNKRTLKQDSIPKAPSRRVKSTCVDIENTPIRIRGTGPTSNTQYRLRIKDYTKPSVSKDKTCIANVKSL
ncbi:hypothetical protein HanXRQr2_Chr10g0421941 [Helianthus annuus]|uniref:Uncharacterized protein n=1 Tax=Helianthus annuus TaxID=4232 RepID=A0A251TGE9_HELAN|nr:uncharacterized protein LOC110880713 [Helianthus annuus]KAF5784872.1 hypothetical protein HanXRQr2_Chr10g0421941 [Helianthus annuus]KAJ0520054.1 hypothetical protein HanIR_Chr10g0455161 [Helianthus annuus]KAJ0528635.1 hypothetical protein HanHA89_Chr10g0368601 [Helianthus annuus]